ncbi:AAA family ATPase [Sulfitobacter sp. BDSS02]|nr:AAA family ATPase [Sulfitobacter sp. BDSS02]
MNLPVSGAHAPAFTLNPWFQPALDLLISSDLLSLPSEETEPQPSDPGQKWLGLEEQCDVAVVATLMRLCAALPMSAPETVDFFYDPFHLTVVVTGEETRVHSAEEALKRGLLLAMSRAHKHLPSAKVFSSSPERFGRFRTRAVAEFAEDTVKYLSRRSPFVVVVGSRDELPDGIRSAVSNYVTLGKMSQDMVSTLYALVHEDCDGDALNQAMRDMPDDETLANLTTNDVALAARQLTPAKMAASLKSLVPVKAPVEKKHSLSEVKGLTSARPHLQQIVEDMALWSSGELAWADIPQGVLLYGPPGTGKTFTAGKLAEEMGAHFVATSYADWQKAGHLGDFLSAMNESFKQAKENAPAVLFIDEIDSFGDRANSRDKNESYIRGAVNGLLEQLDGAKSTEGVIVIAACNDVDVLDAALIRSGRFDLKIPVELPDMATMAEILAAHVGAEIPRAALQDIAAHLVGHSGADAAAVARQARSLARQRRQLLSVDDLRAAANLLAPPVSRDDLWRAAVHEAGHVVAGVLSGRGVPIRARIGVQGGEVQFPPLGRYPTEEMLQRLLVSLMGGRAAENCFLSAVSAGAGGAEDSDLGKATLIAARIEHQFGFGTQGLVWRPLDSDDLPGILRDAEHRSRIGARLDEAMETAEALLSEEQEMVLDVAKALVQERELKRDQLAPLLQTSSAERVRDQGASRVPATEHTAVS